MRQKILSLTREDFEWETMRGTGPGGQNRNKRETAIRVRHAPSGAEAIACDEREQHKNKVLAFKRITKHPKFLFWLKMQTNPETKNIEKEVNDMMQEHNLKVEYAPFK